MSDKSTFTEEEWRALVDAPMFITMTMVAVGSHGPISMAKESMASVKAVTRPSNHDAANLLISQIAKEAEGKQARHDTRHHEATNIPTLVDVLLSDLEPAKKALAKIPDDEATGVVDWFVDIAEAVAEAAKGVKPEEQETIDRIRAIFS